MRLPDSDHTSRPWRIHELTPDFRLEDVWALPGVGGPNDFTRLVQGVAAFDPSRSRSTAVRTLFAIRRQLGALLGLDRPAQSVGTGVATLRDRLPADLQAGPAGPRFAAVPFTSLYQTDDEWAAEAANRTMHGVLHLGLIPDRTGGFRAQMAILVKANGLLGHAYMAAIKPFRHRIVYPAILPEMGRAWQAARSPASSTGVPA
jgi:hypothetical protein